MRLTKSAKTGMMAMIRMPPQPHINKCRALVSFISISVFCRCLKKVIRQTTAVFEGNLTSLLNNVSHIHQRLINIAGGFFFSFFLLTS